MKVLAHKRTVCWVRIAFGIITKTIVNFYRCTGIDVKPGNLKNGLVLAKNVLGRWILADQGGLQFVDPKESISGGGTRIEIGQTSVVAWRDAVDGYVGREWWCGCGCGCGCGRSEGGSQGKCDDAGKEGGHGHCCGRVAGAGLDLIKNYSFS